MFLILYKHHGEKDTEWEVLKSRTGVYETLEFFTKQQAENWVEWYGHKNAFDYLVISDESPYEQFADNLSTKILEAMMTKRNGS